jgi:predicted PhzF superfamily epimerase YddE/YHI9
VIRRLQVDLVRSANTYSKRKAANFYFVTRETIDRGARLHARMLFYGGGPSHGFCRRLRTAWMVAHGVAADERVLIEQGIEMLRPSRFLCAPRAWITEWLTFASEEMLWKSCAEKLLSEAPR